MRSRIVAGACVVLCSAAVNAQQAVPGSRTPVAVTPVITTPTDPASIAEAHVASTLATARDTLARFALLPVVSGVVVRFVQRHDGVIVRDGGAAVLVSPSGRVLQTNDFTARAIPARPRIALTVAEAAALARREVGGTDPGDDAQRTVLVWTREFGSYDLVYECDLAPLAAGLPDAPRILVAASTGRVVLRTNRVSSHRAMVFRANPVISPAVEEVELTGLTDGTSGLVSADIDGHNCVDRNRTYPVEGADTHLCTPEHTARPDAAGLFSFDVTAPNTTDDPYAELSMFYHASEHLAFMRRLGFTTLRTQPLRTIANLRFPWGGTQAQIADPNGPLFPYNNAAFVPGTPPNFFSMVYGNGGDSLMFGQGVSVDFAYDGDVVAHELGHAIVAATAAFGDPVLDRWGSEIAPRALNESIADYFSCARAGDPRVGEYAAGGQWSGGSIRDLSTLVRYPEDLIGEEHVDSVPFSTTLWSLRVQLGARFDGAVYEAMVMSSNAPRNHALAELIVASTQRLLGDTAATSARGLFSGRGIMPNQARVVSVRSGGANLFRLPAGNPTHRLYTPGFIQFYVEVPPGSYAVTVALRMQAQTLPVVHAFVHANEPVSFTYDGLDRVASNAEAEMTLEGPQLRGRVEITPEMANGTLYVALAVEAGNASWAGPIRITFDRNVAASDAGTARSDGSTDAGRDAASADAGQWVATGGAGCSVPARRQAPWSSGAAASVVVAAFVLARTTRRRRPMN